MDWDIGQNGSFYLQKRKLPMGISKQILQLVKTPFSFSLYNVLNNETNAFQLRIGSSDSCLTIMQCEKIHGLCSRVPFNPVTTLNEIIEGVYLTASVCQTAKKKVSQLFVFEQSPLPGNGSTLAPTLMPTGLVWSPSIGPTQQPSMSSSRELRSFIDNEVAKLQLQIADLAALLSDVDNDVLDSFNTLFSAVSSAHSSQSSKVTEIDIIVILILSYGFFLFFIICLISCRADKKFEEITEMLDHSQLQIKYIGDILRNTD